MTQKRPLSDPFKVSVCETTNPPGNVVEIAVQGAGIALRVPAKRARQLASELEQAANQIDGEGATLKEHSSFECKCGASMVLLVEDFDGELANEEPECPCCGELMMWVGT